MLAGELYLLRRSVDSIDARRLAEFNNSFRNNAAPATNINPSKAVGKIEPFQKLAGDELAPAAHPLVVVDARGPAIGIAVHVKKDYSLNEA